MYPCPACKEPLKVISIRKNEHYGYPHSLLNSTNCFSKLCECAKCKRTFMTAELLESVVLEHFEQIGNDFAILKGKNQKLEREVSEHRATQKLMLTELDNLGYFRKKRKKAKTDVIPFTPRIIEGSAKRQQTAE